MFLKPGANPTVTVTYDTSVGTNNSFLSLNINSTNSNTINLAAGVALPALFLSLGGVSGLVGFDLAWLILMTSVAVLLLSRARGAGRWSGTVLVALYLVFVSVHLARP